MPSKLGPHILKETESVQQMIRAGCRIVKFMGGFDLLPEVTDPAVTLIGRYPASFTAEEQRAKERPEEAARRFIDSQREFYARHPAIKLWEGHNEPMWISGEDMGWYAQFEIARLKMLADMGLRGVIGCFATGSPSDMNLWTMFIPAVQIAKLLNGVLGLHEYSSPWMWWLAGKHQANPGDDQGDEGWVTLRYRKVLRHYLKPEGCDDVQIAITECGLSIVSPNPAGTSGGTWRDSIKYWMGQDGSTDPIDYWRGTDRDPERYYAEQLIWYDRELRKDANVIGAAIFTVGALEKTPWVDYDIDNTRVASYLSEYINRERDVIDKESSAGSETPQTVASSVERNEVLVNFALNDRPVGEDKLGYDDYAKAFAQVLANPDTKTPLTIGIYGSWGMGKSFLMEKIKEQLKKAKGAMEEERKKKGLGVKDYHDFHFVHFNAWVYSGSENLWAGLVTKLYSEVERYFGSTQLNWHLMMEGLRSRWKKTIFIAAAYGVLAVLLSLLLDYNKVQQSWDAVLIAVNTLAGGSLVVALGSIIKTVYDFSSKLIFVRSEQLATLSSRKDFRDKIGFMADIKTEIGRIGKMLNAGKEGRPVRFVIFIDDLDRCPPAKAVEVLEAIMLLLADDDGIPFIIFLGIDARVIVKAIEERYGKVLTEAGITGYEYLDKIVQIPFRIPPANETALKNYVESLLWRSDKERKEAKEIKERKEKEEREKREKGERGIKEIKGEVEQGVDAGAMSQTQTEGEGAVAASPDHKLPAQSDQVARESPKITQVKIQSVEVPFKDEEQTAFKDFSRYYTPNPRRIKRIVNIYRIVRLLAGEQSAEFRRKMIKWVILSEQWPYRVAWGLQKIEDENQLGHTLNETLSLWSVFESVKERVGEGKESLANLDGDKEVFEVFAKLEPLITVGDIKQLRAYTFNLNPALQSEVIKAATVKSLDAGQRMGNE